MITFIWPFERLAKVLPIDTLANRIREMAWRLREHISKSKASLKAIKELKSEFEKGNINGKNINSLIQNAKLFSEGSKETISLLKLINFDASAMIYKVYGDLKSLKQIIQQQKSHIVKQTKTVTKASKKKGIKMLEQGFKKVIDKIQDWALIVSELKRDDAEIKKLRHEVVKALKKVKWHSEKQLQREFSFSEIVFRSIERLNMLVRIKAIKIKNLNPERLNLIRRLKTKFDQKDFHGFVRVYHKMVNEIENDFKLSKKMITKNLEEIDEYKKIIKEITMILNQRVAKIMKANRELGTQVKNAISSIGNKFRIDLEELDKNIKDNLSHIYRNSLAELNKVAGERLGYGKI